MIRRNEFKKPYKPIDKFIGDPAPAKKPVKKDNVPPIILKNISNV
jgi:hypothetical protein